MSKRKLQITKIGLQYVKEVTTLCKMLIYNKSVLSHFQSCPTPMGSWQHLDSQDCKE